MGYEALKSFPVVDDIFNSVKAIPNSIINPSSLVDDVIPKGSSGFLDVLGKTFFVGQTAFNGFNLASEQLDYYRETGSFDLSKEASLKAGDFGISKGLGYIAFANPLMAIPSLAWTFKEPLIDAEVKRAETQLKNGTFHLPHGPKI